MKASEELPAKKRKIRTKSKLEVLLPDIRPLSSYVSDRSSLLDQLFLAMDADDIQALLLPTLQGRTIADLKQDCLVQLKKLTEQQVLDILQECVTQLGPRPEGSVPLVDAPRTTTPTNNADQSTDRSVGQTPDPEVSGVETTEEFPKIPPDGGGTLHLCPDQIEMESLEDANVGSIMAPVAPASLAGEPSGGEPCHWSEAKTEREIMELEFRARAIRSLMRAQGLIVVEDDDDGGDIRLKVVGTR